VRKPHFDFLSLTARLLKGFSIGESANSLTYILIDIAMTPSSSAV
jgi:hypothetical protein